jgi:hypothetical protein
MNISAITGPVTRNSPGLKPSRLNHAVFVQVSARNWGVCGAESHGLGADLANATGRTDGLVVHTCACGGFVGFSPFCINWEWESRASASDVGSHCSGSHKGQADSGHEGFKFQHFSS